MKSIKAFVPRPLRRWVRRSPLASAAMRVVAPPLKRLLRKGASHDEIYGDDYFAMIDETSRASAEIMADSILKRLQPSSVLDLGCGTGTLLERLRDLGVAVRGLEHASSALRYCRERGLDVLKMDLGDPVGLAETSEALGSYDLAVCFEVAHQIPPELADVCVSFLCQHADRVIFSADSGGSDRLPLNPRPPAYWIGKFSAEGFVFNEELSHGLQEEWKDRGAAPWFHRFPMVFERTSGIPQSPKI